MGFVLTGGDTGTMRPPGVVILACPLSTSSVSAASTSVPFRAALRVSKPILGTDCPGSMFLNFSVQIERGVSNMARPLAIYELSLNFNYLPPNIIFWSLDHNLIQRASVVKHLCHLVGSELRDLVCRLNQT